MSFLHIHTNIVSPKAEFPAKDVLVIGSEGKDIQLVPPTEKVK